MNVKKSPRTIIVHGPQGCGKTTNAERLRAFFGCAGIVDDYDAELAPLSLGHLHLTYFPFPVAKRRLWRQPFCTKQAEVFSFDFAMKMLAPEKEASLLKPTNPKDAVGIRKWRQYATVPSTVVAEVGVAMMEGALKYGRHNYRVAGVRASVYVDAAKGHVDQWWEGEDLDPDTKLSHITKAIASLVVLRDAMIQDMLNDDRPPRAKLDKVRANLQAVVDEMFDKYPEPLPAFTEEGERKKTSIPASTIKALRSAPSYAAGGIVGALLPLSFPLDAEASGSGCE